MTGLLHEKEFSRKSFIEGGGRASLAWRGDHCRQGRGRNKQPGRRSSASHTGAVPGPPNAALVDSWLQVNPDNTVTLFHGWAEMGQGSPTAVRMIAAEELGMSMRPGGRGADRHERVAFGIRCR